MKLDKDLIREILLKIEADANPNGRSDPLEVPGHSDGEVHYHVMLLAEAGFVQAMDATTMDGIYWIPERLTYQGHEFLDTIRDTEVWGRTKAIASKVGGASVAAVWELAKAEVKVKLGLA